MRSIEMELEKIVSDLTTEKSIKEWKTTQNDFDQPLFDYRLDHVREVVRVAKILAGKENANLEIVVPAAWLHDIAKPGLGGVEEHGLKSALKARRILKDIGFEKTLIEKITEVITKHVGLFLDAPLDSLEAQILWEADKLVKLGSTGLVHYFINSIRLWPGRTLFDIKNGLETYLKTARRIASSMQTETAKKIAEFRLQTIESFVVSLKKELGSKS
ncbi:MAG: HD domain-containing protein [Candidatus Lokiarchaeota archaeon]|nr:HD domain-containing protein [Candidatus Lokiarchaeota archaeon]